MTHPARCRILCISSRRHKAASCYPSGWWLGRGRGPAAGLGLGGQGAPPQQRGPVRHLAGRSGSSGSGSGSSACRADSSRRGSSSAGAGLCHSCHRRGYRRPTLTWHRRLHHTRCRCDGSSTATSHNCCGLHLDHRVLCSGAVFPCAIHSWTCDWLSLKPSIRLGSCIWPEWV